LKLKFASNSFYLKSIERYGGLEVSTKSVSGLGLIATQELKGTDLLVEVPTDVAVVASSGESNNQVIKALFPASGPSLYESAPWWAQLSLQINFLHKIDSRKSVDEQRTIEMKPWLDSLPNKFSTPIHWNKNELESLQYSHMIEAVKIQSQAWKHEYNKLLEKAGGQSSYFENHISFDAFVWGCEIARSRAFSAKFAGSAFNPGPYAFTLFLVIAYVGLGLGTVEQAANGAGLVFCGSILKDFVLPKLAKTRRYVICPFIDMANHVSCGEKGQVAFEYFSNGYSLAMNGSEILNKDSELFISYGPRSNDQLLQYYGFIENDNPHDVYVMPPLREWNIEAMEKACGREFSTERIQKLDRAGLLGDTSNDDKIEFGTEDDSANRGRGVVLTRANGIDPAVMTAIRALVSSDVEWETAGEAIGNFAAENSGGVENERIARLAVKSALELELVTKPTTIEEDEAIIKKAFSKSKLYLMDENDLMAVRFRLEKKKILQNIINSI